LQKLGLELVSLDHLVDGLWLILGIVGAGLLLRLDRGGVGVIPWAGQGRRKERKNRMRIFDGHNDTLQMMYLPEANKRPFLAETDSGHIDLPRAKRGGLGGGFFSIFVPHPGQNRQGTPPGDPEGTPAPRTMNTKPVDFSYAHRLAKKGIESFFALEAASSREFRVVRKLEEIHTALEQDALSAIIHFEGAEPLDPPLESLQRFWEEGLRSIGIVWSRENAFGYGVPFEFPGTPDVGPGLTDAGKELVRACNQLGILLDLSHLNEKGFWDVEKISKAPLVATHSCVHALCPSPRNLTDKQLDAIGASGGIVGVNFSVKFVRKDGEQNPDTPLRELVRHFCYIADRIGIDRLAIGSDFDGTTIPRDIGDVTGLPKVMAALRDGGFDEEALEKIALKNWLRVISHTWK
jgi:membrane dipeptidase